MTALDTGNIDWHVHAPGVAFVSWKLPGQTASAIMERAMESTSRSHPDVRFGSVDVSKHAQLAEDFAVSRTPRLMVYRDGLLVFSAPGALPESFFESLIDAVFELDIDAVRDGSNGHRPRLTLTIRASGEPGFEVEGAGSPPSGQQPGGAGRKH